MEVRPGYKQTEVGVIPEDWEVKPLGSIASIATGNTPPTRDAANFGDEFLFVSPVDLGFSKHIFRTEKMLSKKGFSISRPFPKGSVLFVCIGSTIGKCGIASETLTSNQQINAILPSAELSSDYLYYAVSAVAPKVKSLAGEQAVPIVNKTQFSETAIPLPPTLAEQKAIAEALIDADALIESLEQLIAKKRQIKQGAMQELLTGKKRLPGFSGEWEVKRLGEIATFFSGGTPSTAVSDYYAGEIPWITSGDLNKNYIYEVQGRISKSGLENSAAKMIEANTLLIALYGATAGVTAISKIQAAINQAVLAIVPHYDDTYFLYFMLSHRKEWLITTYTQGGQPNLSGEIVKSVEFSRPSLEEQTAIAAILSDMDAEIAALEAKLAKARQLKQGMMQELLTGRIRLK